MSSFKKHINLIRVIGTLSFLMTHVKTLARTSSLTERHDIDYYPTNHEINGRGEMLTNMTVVNAC